MPQSLLDRFMSKVVWNGDEDECWAWEGYVQPNGYGQLSRGGRRDGRALAHRLAYELFVGPIPDGLVIDHLCRNRACVNPAHLEPVTNAENHARGAYAQKTHCKRGHPFDEENTYRRTDRPTGGRQCRACNRERRRSTA